MSDYPATIYDPRVVENKSGVTYTPAKKNVLYAEDINFGNDEIVAIETELGSNPKGAFTSVADRLDHCLYSEADTLDSVTTRGNSTTNSITIGSTLTAGISAKSILCSDFAGSGQLLAGSFIGSATADNFFVVATQLGTAGKIVGIDYYNGSAWYSALEIANISTGGTNRGNLLLMKSGGNVGINKTPSFALDVGGDINIDDGQWYRVKTGAIIGGTEVHHSIYVGSTDLTFLKYSDGSTLGTMISTGQLTLPNFVSDVETGTQPYACSSTSLNTNLNADLLDGHHWSDIPVYTNYWNRIGTTLSPATITDDIYTNGNLELNNTPTYNVPFNAGNWTLDAPWSVAGGKLVKSGGTSGGYWAQLDSFTPKAFTKYEITVVASGFSPSGQGFKFDFGGVQGTVYPPILFTDGTYTFPIVTQNTDKLRIQGWYNVDGTIDSITIVEKAGNVNASGVGQFNTLGIGRLPITGASISTDNSAYYMSSLPSAGIVNYLSGNNPFLNDLQGIQNYITLTGQGSAYCNYNNVDITGDGVKVQYGTGLRADISVRNNSSAVSMLCAGFQINANPFDNPIYNSKAIEFNNDFGGTDIYWKKWGLYNAGNLESSKVFLGADNVKTYFGSNYDMIIYFDGVDACFDYPGELKLNGKILQSGDIVCFDDEIMSYLNNVIYY